MATLVIPQTMQIAIEMTCSGQPVWNVLHFKDTGTFGVPSVVLANVKTAWEKAAGPLKIKSSSVTMVGYHYTDLRSTTGAVAFLGSTTAGGVAGGLSTMASTALIKLSTGTRSRSQQGRLYHGPLLETQINTDGRTLDSTHATALATAYNGFISDLNVGTFYWAIASRKLLTSTPITSVGVASVIATQRRRLR
jgi:hypothetical protein